MLTTTIKLQSRPGKRKELFQTIQEVQKQISENTNCWRVNVYRHINDKDIFFLTNIWSNKQDLDDYLSSRLFSVLLGVQSTLLSFPLEMDVDSEDERRYERSDTPLAVLAI